MGNGAMSLQSTAATSKVTLGDLLVFINWIQQVQRAYEGGDALPPSPDVDSEQVKSWVHLVGKLHERFRQSEDKQMALEANLQAQETEVARLVSHLHENIASLYDTLGQNQKAQEVRRRVAVLHTH